MLESTPQAGGTTLNVADTALEGPGRLTNSVLLTTARGGTTSWACDSSDVSSPTMAAGEEECAYCPRTTTTATRTAIGQKPSCSPVALPSYFLRSPRAQHGMEGTAVVDSLRVEGVGGDPSLWECIQHLPAGAPEGTAATVTEVTHPPQPCRDKGLPTPSCKVKTAPATCAACNGVEHPRRHASTLETISAMAHSPPSVPPECVQGVEMSITVKQTRPAFLSPRGVRTAAGVGHCAADGGGRHGQGIPSLLHKQDNFQETDGGAIRRAAAPCIPLLKSFSWAGGDEIIATAAGRHGGVAVQIRSEHTQRRGSDTQRETSRAEDLQLHVTDTPGNTPRPRSVRVATTACTRRDVSSPRSRGGGGGDGVHGEGEPPLTTPFSR